MKQKIIKNTFDEIFKIGDLVKLKPLEDLSSELTRWYSVIEKFPDDVKIVNFYGEDYAILDKMIITTNDMETEYINIDLLTKRLNKK